MNLDAERNSPMKGIGSWTIDGQATVARKAPATPIGWRLAIVGLGFVLIGSGVAAGVLPKHGRGWIRLDNAATLLTIVGVAIGLLALALAIAFNWGNLRALQDLGHSITDHVSKELLQRLPPDADKADQVVGGEPGENEALISEIQPDPASPSLVFKLPSGRTLALYQPEAVPMRVIADLVAQWRVEGRGGRWLIGNLEWAVRAVGRGNHPWLLQFKDDPVVWRVAYGGRGRVGEQAVVTELPVTDKRPGAIYG